MSMSLPRSESSVVITGGASGIGAATARLLVSQGVSVSLLDINKKRLNELIEELGDKARAHYCNVCDEEDIERTVARILEYGTIYGLVCCAGMPDIPKPAESIALQDWDALMQSQVTSTMLTCKHVGGYMINNGGGAIVNLASVVGFNAGPVLAYGAAKAAIVNMTASLAVQWAGRGVRVNAVAPGWTDTPFLKPAARGNARDYSPIINSTPAGRLMQPEEIANVIAFLLSPNASAIVGTTIACDGGVLAGAGWSPYGGWQNKSVETSGVSL